MGDTDTSPATLPGYDPDGYYCEALGSAERGTAGGDVLRRLREMGIEELSARAEDAARELYNLGITFTVYSDREMIDRILPFDVLPRMIAAAEWEQMEQGAKQRVEVLNLFLKDIYHDRNCIKDGIIPEDLVLGNKNYREQMVGLDVPQDVYVHVCGIDLVRGGDGLFRVLEDNARTPSGVSYVIENRHMMQRAFPELIEDIGLKDVDDYGPRLLQAMLDVSPEGVDDPTVALLSPGAYNSAYFEHIFLAREMGVTLVEGSDLSVENDRVYMRTTDGLEPVHSIYRRIDDDFLDPQAFREDSLLGVPGLFDAYRKGNVTLANAIGTGIADDKAVYAYMPRLIKYYLDEDPILLNVDTHICREPEGLAYTLENLENLVVKPVGESGGYGILIGPRADAAEIEEFRVKIKDDPANFISQPVIDLSVCPTLIGDAIEPRHVDLRPFCVTGKSTWVLPGGLTRVALRRGSLVVNSSQGGGSKDTWVFEE
jgi:uncharacterized circularly permuted ATP-grasp superfamily protein